MTRFEPEGTVLPRRGLNCECQNRVIRRPSLPIRRNPLVPGGGVVLVVVRAYSGNVPKDSRPAHQYVCVCFCLERSDARF